MRFEKDHVIPNSIWWTEDGSNIAMTPKERHKLKHEILKIPHSLIRNMRSQLNDTLIRTPNKLKIQQYYQREFFKNSNRLPEDLLWLQTDSFTRQILFREYQIRSIEWELWIEEKTQVEESLKIQPWKNWKHLELLDESRTKLEELFKLEQKKSIRAMQYIKDVYNLPDINGK